MANLKAKTIGYQIGVQSDRTTRATTLIDIAPPEDGVQLTPDPQTEALNTDHGSQGILYTDLASRNLAEQRASCYLYPNAIGTFFDAVFKRDSNADLYYHSVFRWWTTSALASHLGGTEDKGEVFEGCLFSSMNLNIARIAKNDSLMGDFGVFINAKRRLLDAETAPTYDFCDRLPFGSAGALVDFVRDETADSFGADDTSVRSVSIQYASGTTVEGVYDAPADAPLHRAWSSHAPGDEVANISVVVRVTRDEELRLDEYTTPPAGSLRIALTHPAATSITSTSTITAGTLTAQTLLVASTTGFAVGDVVCITHPTSGFVLARVSTVNAGVSIVVNGTTSSDPRVTLNGSSGGPLTVKNMAAGIVFDRMDFLSRSPVTRDGAFRVVTLNYQAALLAGQSRILEYFAYNHTDAHA